MRRNSETSNSPEPKSRGLQPARPFLSRRTFSIAQSPRGLKPRGSLFPAFTLIELMVVIGIIGLLLAITIPAIGPMLTSNHMAQAVNTMNGLLVQAQTLAEAQGTPVAVRIEQAYQTNLTVFNGRSYPTIKDASGIVRKLPYQQARLVSFDSRRPSNTGTITVENTAFHDVRGSKVTALPKSAWLAPATCIEPPPGTFGQLDDASLRYQPRDDNGFPAGVNNPNAIEFNRMDNFYLVFDQRGALEQFRTDPNDVRTHYWYRDENQPYGPTTQDPEFPFVNHPDDSPRGVLVYERERFTTLNNTDADRRVFLQRSRPVFISRFLGSTVEGQIE